MANSEWCGPSIGLILRCEAAGKPRFVVIAGLDPAIDSGGVEQDAGGAEWMPGSSLIKSGHDDGV
jgi:hypothetical protein